MTASSCMVHVPTIYDDPRAGSDATTRNNSPTPGRMCGLTARDTTSLLRSPSALLLHTSTPRFFHSVARTLFPEFEAVMRSNEVTPPCTNPRAMASAVVWEHKLRLQANFETRKSLDGRKG